MIHRVVVGILTFSEIRGLVWRGAGSLNTGRAVRRARLNTETEQQHSFTQHYSPDETPNQAFNITLFGKKANRYYTMESGLK